MVDATQSLPARTGDGLRVFETFGATFRTFGMAPLQFLALSLAGAVPTILYLLILQPTSTNFTAASAVLTIVNMLTLYFMQIPMTYIAARLLDGRSYSMTEAFQFAAGRYLPVLGTTILALLAVYGGLILLIVPGLIFACVYAVILPVCALEGLGPIASMKRSGTLTKYQRWRILGVYVLFFLPLMILSGGAAGLLTLRGAPLLGQWISEAIQIVWVPLAAIFSVTIYFALRRLKENVGVASVFE